jgi:hypothetical protein
MSHNATAIAGTDQGMAGVVVRLPTPVENSSFCRLKIPQPWSSGGLQFRLVDGT